MEGLTQKKARELLLIHGKNEIQEKGLGLFRVILESIDILLFFLIVATILNIFIGDIVESIVILLMVVLIVGLSVTQRFTAQGAINSLKKLVGGKSTVIRDGEKIEIDVKEIVPGDIVFLSPGDKVPADGEIIEETSITVDESLLTGESIPVNKSKGSRLHGGTLIGRGTAYMEVESTGSNTELARITKLASKAETTPLEKKVKALARELGVYTIMISSAIFIIYLLNGVPFNEILLTTVAIVVAAVPESLPLIVSLSLAIGTVKMAKNNAIIRTLPSVEALGSTTIICCDKTGTLTKNEMTVTTVWQPSSSFVEVTGTGYAPKGTVVDSGRDLKQLIKSAVLCNDSFLRRDDGKWKIIGDPTEGALLVLSKKGGVDSEQIRHAHPRFNEKAFDATRAMMSTLNKQNGRFTQHTKGTTAGIISKSTQYLEDGKINKMTREMRERILRTEQKMAKDGLRVLAFAYRKSKNRRDLKEKELIFTGLVGMMDPIREGVVEAIKMSHDAGIKIAMITGDNKDTAISIARSLGIYHDGDSILTSKELLNMSAKQLDDIIDNVTVYARTTPEHKMRIVEALKRRNNIVAMTGDGVNDAPALMRADIGIGMGSGTEVAKQASKMILADDNFATIVHAIRDGRKIFDNIRNFTSYIVSANAAELIMILLATVMGLPLPFIALQLLWINFVTDAFPAFGLGLMTSTENVMKRGPRDPKEGIIGKKIGRLTVVTAIWIALGAILMFMLTLDKGLDFARTAAFTILVIAELANVLNFKSAKRVLRRGLVIEKEIIYTTVAGFIMFLLVFIQPIADIFKIVPLTNEVMIAAAIFGFLTIVIGDLEKIIAERYLSDNKNKKKKEKEMAVVSH